MEEFRSFDLVPQTNKGPLALATSGAWAWLVRLKTRSGKEQQVGRVVGYNKKDHEKLLTNHKCRFQSRAPSYPAWMVTVTA